MVSEASKPTELDLIYDKYPYLRSYCEGMERSAEIKPVDMETLDIQPKRWLEGSDIIKEDQLIYFTMGGGVIGYGGHEKPLWLTKTADGTFREDTPETPMTIGDFLYAVSKNLGEQSIANLELILFTTDERRDDQKRDIIVFEVGDQDIGETIGRYQEQKEEN
jgi:hypothetical protein